MSPSCRCLSDSSLKNCQIRSRKPRWFVNVKIYLFGITALTGFVTPYSKVLWILIGVEFLIATIGTIATFTWIGGGLLIQEFYSRHYRIINILLALTLLECIWSMLCV